MKPEGAAAAAGGFFAWSSGCPLGGCVVLGSSLEGNTRSRLARPLLLFCRKSAWAHACCVCCPLLHGARGGGRVIGPSAEMVHGCRVVDSAVVPVSLEALGRSLFCTVFTGVVSPTTHPCHNEFVVGFLQSQLSSLAQLNTRTAGFWHAHAFYIRICVENLPPLPGSRAITRTRGV